MKALDVFIRRPVATTLLSLAMVLTGLLAYGYLPVAPLPQVDFPMITVSARLPGASPETMASSVAMPLEQALGAISGLNDMSSSNSEGSTRIMLRFDMGRDINSAAREVQAAINAARPMLPSGLRSNPSYHKVNPSSAPIMVLALTSETATQGQLYDIASTVIAQKLAQVPGVGEVSVGGSSLPAVRVSLNPKALASNGVALDQVRQVLADANTMRPNGLLENDDFHWQVSSGGQLKQADNYTDLIVSWKDGRPIRLQDVATVEDSVEDPFNIGFYNHRSAVLLIIRRQPDANIIETVDAVRKQLPAFQAMVPANVDLAIAQDRTPGIRASLQEAQITLVIAVALVVLVVLLFLRNLRAALIPSLVVPASLITTFAVMLWLGFTLNTISLMAMIVATGFVVDDAIVVLENITRHIEKGLPPLQAAYQGVREVSFTVVAMSLSLVAVFIPLLLMPGMIGRMFEEFAVTLSVAILISLVLSLMLTPMMCAYLLKRPKPATREPGSLLRFFKRAGASFWVFYQRSLRWALRHRFLTLLALLATIGVNFYLYAAVPKGFFPQQDTGQLMGFFRVDEGTSFQAMTPKLQAFRETLLADPAVESVTGFAGGRGGSHSSFLMIQLKPREQRSAIGDVVNRLRGQFSNVPAARLTLVPQQDIPAGGHQGSAAYSFALMGSDVAQLKEWAPRIRQALAKLPELVDVDSDAEDRGQRIELIVDRDAAKR
ncbi:MAG TPA: efflux RND transporter permease subunit, partial [Burkholderiaceae bacterium]|nr:efflux RND transporter permease subunit [Burkholderiaceae bacterium]